MRDLTPTPDPVRDGRFWLFADGTRLPVISGGADDDGGGGDDGGAPPAGGNDDGGQPPRTFTQDEVDALLGQRLAEDRRRRDRALQEALGGMTAEEAAQRLAAIQEAERERMTEVERREAEAADRERQAEARERAAQEQLRNTTVTAGLVRAGVLDGDAQEDLRVLLGRHLVDDTGAPLDEVTAEAVDQAVAALRDRRPELFGSTGGGSGPTPPPSGAPAAPPRPQGGKGTADAFERGRQRAAAYQGGGVSTGAKS